MDTPLQQLVLETFKLSSEQELLDAGYRQFPPHNDHQHKNAKAAFQKKVRAGVFFNIYSYDLSDLIPSKTDLSFSVDIQLRNERKCYNIQLLHDTESLAEIESFLLAHVEWFESRYGKIGDDD